MKTLKFLSGVGVATVVALAAMSAHSAQVLKPKHAGGGLTGTTPIAAGTDISSGTVTLPATSTLYFDMEYSVTGSQTANEAGIGFKIGYDSAFFDLVVPATSITALHTKCMIASPSDQAVSGTQREVVFGWIDTSIRTTPTAGAVGWPGTADPAAPGATNGCLNPGNIVTESGALAVPTNLFRIGLKSKSTSVVGVNTTVTINTGGNISYANAGNTDTAKTITITGAAAPSCNLDVDNSGSRTAFVDGILIVRHLLNLSGTTLTNGVSITGTRNVPADLTNFMAAINWDMTGAGGQSAFRDGIILVRLMLGIPDTTLLNGVTIPVGATHQTAAAIRANVNSKCGTSF
ncbi:MAG: hypothetical protein JNL19_14670 [Burkholderiales bacterium]|nr:hypothetical protein [Burkholderiales bacterium]